MRVREDTRSRIQEAARALGYVPSRLARGMRLGQSGLVALVVPGLENPYYPALALETQRALWPHGLDLLVYTNPTFELPQVLRAALALGVEGVILVSSHYSQRELEGLGAFPLTFVAVGHAWGPLPIDRVSFDDRAAAREATLALGRAGHLPVAHLSGPGSSPTAQARLAGYLEGVGQLGQEPLVFEGNFRVEGNQAAIGAMLAGGPRGVLAGNDLLALAVLRQALALGLRLPQELTLVGFDDIPAASWVYPALSSIRRPPSRSAEAAVRLLLRRREGYAGPPETLLLPAELVVRDTGPLC